MNTNPDNQTLLFWLEDELDASEKPAVDAWCATQPEWLHKRDAARAWKATLPSIIPAELEPPYADFFQSKVMRAIALGDQAAALAQKPMKAADSRWWSKLWMPITAVAAMVMCFLGGMNFSKKSTRIYSMVIYTPELGVKAEYFQKSPAEGSVIVLNGVAALPDSFEVPQTSALDGKTPDASSTEEVIIAP